MKSAAGAKLASTAVSVSLSCTMYGCTKPPLPQWAEVSELLDRAQTTKLEADPATANGDARASQLEATDVAPFSGAMKKAIDPSDAAGWKCMNRGPVARISDGTRTLDFSVFFDCGRVYVGEHGQPIAIFALAKGTPRDDLRAAFARNGL